MNPGQESSPLAARLAELAQAQPDQLALRWRQLGAAPAAQPMQSDRARLWRRIERMTGHLQSRWGVGVGDRVAWLGLNHELQLVALIACARLGAMLVPLNYRLALPELAQVLDDAQARLLVHDAALATAAQALAAPGRAVCPQEALIEQASPRGLMRPAVQADMPVLLVYTSGTTGRAKGAVHTQATLLANARASAWAHGFVPGDRVLSCLPLFHVGGLCIQTLPALLFGLEVVLHDRFEAGAWLQEMALTRPTLSLLVPATLRAVQSHPDWERTDLSGLRGMMTGSSTIPLPYLAAFHARGVPVGQVYGTTETGPVSVVLRLPDAQARAGAAGWPQPEAQLQLRDAQGQEVPSGQTGEVWLRAANLMRGYWDPSGRTGVGLQDGWFGTGDLGMQDADGCLHIVGRSKDMIISGGENIYPAEIENLLVTLPGVAECAVVGMPDPRWGEVPVAVLVRSDDAMGAALQADAVLAHLQDRIARFKLPRRVAFLPQLPKSALGKVLKAPLQALLAEPPSA